MRIQEQMLYNERYKDAAKAMYLKRVSDPYEIASRFGCPVQHLINWINWGK